MSLSAPHLLAVLRILLGWIFLWAFLDKLLGLGFATTGGGWISGVSPTTGFLSRATTGPLAPVFQSLAGHGWVDWMFMVGLLGIGLALILGIAMRPAALAGSVMLALMYLALLWPKNNPIIDDHIVYIVLLILLAATESGNTWGIGEWWGTQSLVERYPILK